MSLGATLSLSNDPAAEVDTNLTVYDLRAADMGHSEYSVAGLTLPAEMTLTIGHEVGKNGEQRKAIRLNVTALDANLAPATASVYTVMVRPANTAITNALLISMVNRMIDFLLEGTNANVVKVLNGEV